MKYYAQDWRAKRRHHLCKYCNEKFQAVGRKLTVCNDCRPQTFKRKSGASLLLDMR